ncbi:Hsp20 family protein [bacterium]|nr:Hsp20 family protein [bacterium]
MSRATSFSRIWNVSPATLDELRREFDNAIGSVSRSVRDSVSSQLPLALWEDEGQVILEFEVPGIAQKDLDIVVESGVLTVSGKRAVPQRVGKLKHNEHRYGEFARRVRLDETLDPTSVAAELADGILTLTVSRRVEAQPVRVVVQTRSASSEQLPGDVSQSNSVPTSEPHQAE